MAALDRLSDTVNSLRQEITDGTTVAHSTGYGWRMCLLGNGNELTGDSLRVNRGQGYNSLRMKQLACFMINAATSTT